jgi:hypothetical protein
MLRTLNQVAEDNIRPLRGHFASMMGRESTRRSAWRANSATRSVSASVMVLEGRGEAVQTPVEGLVARKRREPRSPVAEGVVVDAALAVEALHVAEQVDG